MPTEFFFHQNYFVGNLSVLQEITGLASDSCVLFMYTYRDFCLCTRIYQDFLFLNYSSILFMKNTNINPYASESL